MEGREASVIIINRQTVASAGRVHCTVAQTKNFGVYECANFSALPSLAFLGTDK